MLDGVLSHLVEAAGGDAMGFTCTTLNRLCCAWPPRAAVNTTQASWQWMKAPGSTWLQQ